MSPEPAADDATRFRPGTYAATHPDRPAVITATGKTVTFAELEERSCRLALATAGLCWNQKKVSAAPAMSLGFTRFSSLS